MQILAFICLLTDVKSHRGGRMRLLRFVTLLRNITYMSGTLRQNLQTRQVQRMTPMQVQFVRLLEMTTPEIEEEVRHAVDENPALEVSDEQTPHEAETETHDDADSFDDDYDSDDMPTARRGTGTSIGIAAADEDTLFSHLERQLGEMNVDPEILRIALYIAGNIDNNGRLTRTLHELETDMATGADIYASEEQMQEAYRLVRSLDPAGIGFIDLRDCLLLQLNRIASDSPDVANAREILTHYYDLYSNKRYDKIQGALGLTAEQMRKAEQVILSLNPKPGTQFGGNRMENAASVIVPDFTVEVDEPNITVSLTSSIPELTISETFRSDDLPERGGETSKSADKAKAFIRHHRDEAKLFIRLLEMRNESLMKTMTAITRLQRDFFLTDDPEKIRPMVLRDIADITGQDLSVISRATSGKYVSTRSGIYPLKMLFTEKSVADEEDGSIHKVLAALRQVIDDEDKRHPLSDEALKEEMARKGFDLARRTIAKYREEKLGLPVARLRKKV